jgi:hypothetical protein
LKLAARERGVTRREAYKQLLATRADQETDGLHRKSSP